MPYRSYAIGILAALLIVSAGVLPPVSVSEVKETAIEETISFARNEACEMSDSKHIEAKMDIQGDFVQITFSKLNVSSLRISAPGPATEIVLTRGFEEEYGYYSLNSSSEEHQMTVKINNDVYQKNRNWTFTRTPRLVALWSDPSGVYCSQLLPFKAEQNTTMITPIDGEYMVSSSGFMIVSEKPPEKTEATLATGSNLTVYSFHTTQESTNISHAVKVLSAVGTEFNVSCETDEITWYSIGESRTVSGKAYQNMFSQSRRVEIWTNERASSNVTDSVIVHEYIHARQCYQTTSEMEWLDEGSAEYYADYIMYNSLNSSYYPTLNWESHPESSLTNRSSWDGNRVEYSKGELAVAYLDYQIQTHSSKSFEDVMRWANNRNDKISYSEFRAKIVSLTNNETGRWMDENIRGESKITVENQTRVESELFGEPSETDLKENDGEGEPDAGVTFDIEEKRPNSTVVTVQVVSMHLSDTVIVQVDGERKKMDGVGDTVTIEVERGAEVIVIAKEDGVSSVAQTFDPSEHREW